MKNTEMELNIYKNKPSGVILGFEPTDYIAGKSSPIKKHKELTSDWRPYMPKHEIQFINDPNHTGNNTAVYETSFCTAYSGTDVIETIFNYYIKNNLISKEDLDWLQEKGYIENGEVNLSERYTGILAGLNEHGGYLSWIGDSLRNYGAIPNSMLPNNANSYEEYVSTDNITQEMRDLGEEFKKRFPISYEWIPDNKAGEYLKYSPLHCTVRYATGEGILDPVGQHNHAVMEVYRTNEYELINDSYYQETKKYKLGNPSYFLAYYIRLNNKDMIFKKDKNSSNIYLINEEHKTKTMVIDMPTLNAFYGEFEEADLSDYTEHGTFVWTERIIN